MAANDGELGTLIVADLSLVCCLPDSLTAFVLLLPPRHAINCLLSRRQGAIVSLRGSTPAFPQGRSSTINHDAFGPLAHFRHLEHHGIYKSSPKPHYVRHRASSAMAYYSQAPVAVAHQYYPQPTTSYSHSSSSLGPKSRGHRLCDTCGKVETPQTGRFRLCGGCMVTQYCVSVSVSCGRTLL